MAINAFKHINKIKIQKLIKIGKNSVDIDGIGFYTLGKHRKSLSDNQKIEFFDSSKQAFFTHSQESTSSVNEDNPKDLDDGFYVYANMKKLSETELEELKSLPWKEYPENFKIFLFDF